MQQTAKPQNDSKIFSIYAQCKEYMCIQMSCVGKKGNKWRIRRIHEQNADVARETEECWGLEEDISNSKLQLSLTLMGYKG